ncbi:hypothetical protein SteCoe_26318 [Stentor coeruleus]|uniref:Uncharacterized protein n=1 Tax=Stentor coeruleus TaxID=5963 RepID=A0A1R2BD69_9CILI|nr:hypothetical protein SteCoe_26318 [Stentor coeruleus]
MGCSTSKALAIEEINQLITQVRLENTQLENELFNLKNQKSIKLFEGDKTTIKKFRNLHNEFSQEIAMLKKQMNSLTIIPQENPETKTYIKEDIEKIIHIQADIESKSEKIHSILNSRKQIKNAQNELENQINDLIKNIEDIDQALKVQQETLKSQKNFEKVIQKYEHEKMLLAFQLKEAETEYKDLREYLKNLDDIDEKKDPENLSFEKLLGMSELEIQKEIIYVDKDLENIVQKINDIEVKELELQQADNYLTAISQRLLDSSNAVKIKQQLIEIHDKITEIKAEKKRVKNEIIQLKGKNNKKVHDNRYHFLCLDEENDSKGKEDTLSCIFETDFNQKKKYYISVTSD